MNRRLRYILTTAACGAGLATAALGAAYASDSGYVQTDLISNDTSKHPAAHQDKSLLNPWGIAFFPGGPFWINDNNAGLSALYNGDGAGVNKTDPALAVTIPPPTGGTPRPHRPELSGMARPLLTSMMASLRPSSLTLKTALYLRGTAPIRSPAPQN
jgi:hypothetical protein